MVSSRIIFSKWLENITVNLKLCVSRNCQEQSWKKLFFSNIKKRECLLQKKNVLTKVLPEGHT